MSQQNTPKQKTKVFSVLSNIATVFSSIYFTFLIYFAITVLIDIVNYVPDDSTVNSVALGAAFFIIFAMYELIPTSIAIIFSIINLFFRKKTGVKTLIINIVYIVVLAVLGIAMITMVN